MNSFKLYAYALLTLGSIGSVALMLRNDLSHCDKASGLCRVHDEETPADKALKAAWAINPWNVLTTLNSVPRDNEGWKPVDVNGTPSEFQIKPTNDKREKGCTLTTVREIVSPKSLIWDVLSQA
jgi:hypothetical protein